MDIGPAGARSETAKANYPLLFEKIREKAIYNRASGPLFRGPYGQFDWMFAFHDFFVDPEALDAFAVAFWEHYREFAPLQIGGLEISGVPLVIAALTKSQSASDSGIGFLYPKRKKNKGMWGELLMEV